MKQWLNTRMDFIFPQKTKIFSIFTHSRKETRQKIILVKFLIRQKVRLEIWERVHRSQNVNSVVEIPEKQVFEQNR